MSTINFYLKKYADGGDEPALIYLRMKYSGVVLTYSTGVKIEPSKWNFKKQEPRVKTLMIAADDEEKGKQSVAEYLKKLRDTCDQYFKSQLETGIPTPQMIKDHLDAYRMQKLTKAKEDKKKNTLYELIDRYIAGEMGDVAQSTRNNYRAVKLHLMAFEKATGYTLNFASINLDFFYRYTAYQSKRLNQNTLAKDVRIIKVFMQGAVDMDLTDNLKFKHKKFTIKSVEPDAVALNEKEIMKVYRAKMPSVKLDRVRDLFVFGCFTGLRFSDYSRVQKENIVDVEGQLMVKITTQKTGEAVIIPTNPIILEILRKYGDTQKGLPRPLSNQKFNDYVKEVCKVAGLDEVGRNSDDLSLSLYQCVSSHTARRSFCTNLYVSGFPVRDIMLISGHKSEKAFNRYIKVTKLDAAKKLAEHQKLNWSKLLLQAV
jgi:integrase